MLAEAMRLQRELAPRVVCAGCGAGDVGPLRCRFADVASDKPNGRGVGAVVVLAYPSLEVAEQVTVETAVTISWARLDCSRSVRRRCSFPRSSA